MPYDLKAMMHWAEAHPWATGGIVLGGGLGLLWLMGAFRSSSSSGANAGGSNVSAYYGAEAAQTQAGAALSAQRSSDSAATAQAKIQADSLVAIDAANNVTSRVNSAGYFSMQTTEALNDNATQVSLGEQSKSIALGQQAADVAMGGRQASTAVALGNQNLQATVAQSNNALAANLANTAAMVTTAKTQATSAAYHDYLTTAMPAEIAVGQTTAGLATFSPTPSGGYSVSVPPLPPTTAAPVARSMPAPWPIWRPIVRPPVPFEPPGRAGASASGGRGGGNR